MPPSQESTRRDFLKASAALAVVAPLAASWAGHAVAAAPASSAAAKPIRKAAKIGMVKVDGSILDKFKVLQDCGYDGVDLMAPTNEKNRYTVDEVLAAQEKTGVIAHGVVDSVHWKIKFSDPDPAARAKAVQALEQAIRDAKAYGGTSVLVVPGVVDKEVSYNEVYDRSQAEIRKVLPLAQELNIRILIENVGNNFLLSPLELARYLDEFNSPVMGSYFDIGNMMYEGWPEQWIRILGKRIVKLDIKEYSRTKAETGGRKAGYDVNFLEGDNDWPTIMAALKEIGYTGWGTSEMKGGDAAYLRDMSQRMDKIFSYYG